MERILSFESGARLTAETFPDSISRRRLCRSSRISAALA
jgi:hypothetical protein